MEIFIFIVSLVCTSLGIVTGMCLYARLSISYRQRWQEALEIIKQEQINTNDLKELEPPPDLPERLQNRKSVPSFNKDFFKNVENSDREEMELYRLKLGLPPKDAMNGVESDRWTRVRKIQLDYGWEHFQHRYYKIK